jgi:hypothetical protein
MIKTAYRVTFAAYFSLFLFLMRECGRSAEWPGFALSSLFAISAGGMLWVSICRPRH